MVGVNLISTLVNCLEESQAACKVASSHLIYLTLLPILFLFTDTNEQLEHLTGENSAIVKHQRLFKDPQLAAEETDLISLLQHNDSIYICLPNGKYFATKDLAAALCMGMKVHFLVHAVYPPKLKAEYNFVTRLCHASSVTLGKAANNLLPKVDC